MRWEREDSLIVRRAFDSLPYFAYFFLLPLATLHSPHLLRHLSQPWDRRQILRRIFSSLSPVTLFFLFLFLFYVSLYFMRFFLTIWVDLQGYDDGIRSWFRGHGREDLSWKFLPVSSFWIPCFSQSIPLSSHWSWKVSIFSLLSQLFCYYCESVLAWLLWFRFFLWTCCFSRKFKCVCVCVCLWLVGIVPFDWMSVENDSVKFVFSWTAHTDPTSQSYSHFKMSPFSQLISLAHLLLNYVQCTQGF